MNEKKIYENWQKTPGTFKNDMLSFQSWFDPTDSVESCLSMGHIDFHTKLLTPEVYKILGDVRQKTCLEIGFGGGRILNAASCIFKNSIGIDIHDFFDITENFLKEQGSKNYKLLHYDQMESIKDESIDFVFSFIVFQHFGSIQVFYDYINSIKRILSNDGCCNIHFGMNSFNSDDYYIKDVQQGTGYGSLYYNPDFVQRVLESEGFKVVSTGRHQKSPWNNNISGQFYVIFKKA